MPVSTAPIASSSPEPRAKRCKHCDESSHRSDSGSGYWQIQLDRDLVDTIAAIYPEWVRGSAGMAEHQAQTHAQQRQPSQPPRPSPSQAHQQLAQQQLAQQQLAQQQLAQQQQQQQQQQAAHAAAAPQHQATPASPAGSPPKAVVDMSPLANTMEQNKQSLKVKLMLRRPINQLIAQGIMPPLKTPPAFHEQRRQLERAKTGDMLKAKIQQRPARHELERRHILEAEPAVDPSLAEKQRMLKKARLADQLNDQLSHRPGPLELIQKNILHTEEPIEEAVKAGRIPFRATCEGQINKPQHPNSYVTYEDDSQSSEDLVSPGPTTDVLEAAAKSAGIVVSLAIPATEGTVVVTSATPVFKDTTETGIVFADLCRTVTAPALLPIASVPSPASLVSSTSTLSPMSSVASPVPAQTPVPVPVLTPRTQPSPARSDAPGKDKNRKKSKSKSAPKTRTIKFHEYKGPPNAQKSSALSAGAAGETSYELLLKQQQLFLQWQLQLQHKYPQIILPAAQKPITENVPNVTQQNSSVTSTTTEITPTRVLSRLEDMKVSDLKAELKKRNLPVSGSKPQLIERLKPFTNGELPNHIIIDAPQSVCSEESLGDDDTSSPRSVEDDTKDMDICEMSPSPNAQTEDIVREQQKQIEELQRKLTLSQMQLQQVAQANSRPENKQRLALQQHLQARRQQQQMALQVQQIQALQQIQQQAEQERQLQHVAFQNSKNLTNGLLLNGAGATLVLNQLVQSKVKLVNGQNRTASLPGFLNTIPLVPAVISAPEIQVKEEPKPPPLYEEATKQIKKEKSSVKSQIVDDVLEILIKNGELPPSAAQDPSTPGSAGTRVIEPVFPAPETNTEDVFSLDNADLRDLGLYMDSIDTMDFSQLDMDINMGQPAQEYENLSIPMDTDDNWLDSLLPAEQPQTAPIAQYDSDMTYDPLLTTQDPFDLFSLDEFKTPNDLSSTLVWDKLDFAA